MGQHYQDFSAFERNFVQSRLNLGSMQMEIAVALGRSRSTVSREVRRNRSPASPSGSGDGACFASRASFSHCRRGLVRLADGSALRAAFFWADTSGMVPATDIRQAEAYAGARDRGPRDDLPGDLHPATWPIAHGTHRLSAARPQVAPRSGNGSARQLPVGKEFARPLVVAHIN